MHESFAQSAQPRQTRFLPFEAGGGRFAIPAGQIEKVALLSSLVGVPGMPPHVMGFFPEADGLCPVVCAASALGLPPGTVTPESAVIFLRSEPRLAIAVDRVPGLFEAALESGCGEHSFNGLATGTVPLGGAMTVVLDAERFLAAEEKMRLAAWTGHARRRIENWPPPAASE